MEALLPEIPREGLVLWRVRQRSSRELWCHLTEFCGELILGIHDLQAADVQLAGVWDVESVVLRSEALRAEYLAEGWQAFDFEEADAFL